MISENFGLDKIDQKIVEIIQNNPNLPHTIIAKKIHRSQPTVGNRIKRLEDEGVLQYQAGLNLKKFDFYFARVEVETQNPSSLIDIVKKCPHMIYALRLSGINNFEVVITSRTLKQLDGIVNIHFRNNPEIINVSMEIIVDIVNDFIFPFDLKDFECKCDKFTENHLKKNEVNQFDI